MGQSSTLRVRPSQPVWSYLLSSGKTFFENCTYLCWNMQRIVHCEWLVETSSSTSLGSSPILMDQSAMDSGRCHAPRWEWEEVGGALHLGGSGVHSTHPLLQCLDSSRGGGGSRGEDGGGEGGAPPGGVHRPPCPGVASSSHLVTSTNSS